MTSLRLISAALLAPALLAAQTGDKPAPSTLVPVPASTLPLKRAPDRTAPAITAKDLMTRLYLFADDSMMGREAGTLGNVRGTDYIAAELKRMGLAPAGENGTYFQTIPLKQRLTDTASTLVVAGTPFIYGRDWSASAIKPMSASAVPIVFGGTIGDSASLIPAEQAVGKVVVYRVAPGAARAARTAARLAPGAVAVGVIATEISTSRRPANFLDDPLAIARGGTVPTLQLSGSTASAMFDAPIEQLATGTAGRSATVNILMKVDTVAYPARNVVAVLRGGDPKLRGQYVALGAHNDHVGFAARAVDHDSLRIYNHIVRPGGAENSAAQATPEQQLRINLLLAEWRAKHPGSMRLDSINNGADDDGSGSVALLEIAEKMAAKRTKPKRSMLFVWHTAEEKGLLGAAYFVDHPTVPRDSIIAAFNLDMVGRGNAWDVTGRSKDGETLRGNEDYLQLVGSRRLSTELGDLVEKTNIDGKFGFRFDYSMDANGHPTNIYCRSDHYHYARRGIPVTFFTTGGHSDYHQITDEPQYINYNHLARIGNFVAAVAERLAAMPKPPVVDKPKPDPQGVCRQ